MEFQDFNSRPYQEDLLKIAVDNNAIIYLPTGSGKTFVAILLIRHLSKSLEKPYLEGGKRTIFLVNTVPLVEQQKEVLENTLPFSVGSYSGDNEVDVWNAHKWKNEIIKNQILVMTSQIFLDMICHGYIGLNECNLVIFDECHHAVEDHPMRNIMKQFEFVPQEEQPRILGLTATLLNGNVKKQRILEEIENLEVTFQGKIATVNAMSDVLGYSTNPCELMVTYTENDNVLMNTLNIGKIIQSILYFLEEVKIPKKCGSYSSKTNVNLIDDQKDIARQLKNIVTDVDIHFNLLGLYGGLKATTIGLIKLMRLKKNIEEPYLFKLISVIDTKLLYIQKYTENIIGNEDSNDKIFKNSSSKVRNLFDLIMKYQIDYEKKRNSELLGIIFVQRRTTAQVLYHILKDLKKSDKFSFINPDFVVGFSNSMYLQYAHIRKSLYLKKCNMSAIRNFNNKLTNLLVSSSVMEEGIDIPSCTFISMFDFPMNYRSYIQSKGRARHKDGKYYLLIPDGKDKIKLVNKFQMYKETEDFLRMFLVGKNEERSIPSENEIKSQLYDHIIEPYRVESTNAVATLTSSIALINRYCNSLPQDKFTESAPMWYKEKSNSQICVYLEFPMQSPVKEVIKGPYMRNIRDAKRAAALKAVQKLYEMGELNDLLLPKEHACLLNDFKVKCLFSHWQKEKEVPIDSVHGDYSSGNDSIIKPGSKKFRRSYKKKCPEVYINILSNTSNVYYLHIIEFNSLCEKSSFSFSTIKYFEKVMSQHTFAILSKKSFQEVCDFPIYFSFGEVNVSLKTNYRKIVCNESEIEKIRQFHCFLFSDVLKLLKSFLIFDTDGKEYSYFVTPVIFLNGEYSIDYKSIEQKLTLEEVCEPDLDTKKNLIVTKEDYVDSIVFPWYRESIAGYLVCDVCEDINSLSEFPTNEFRNFVDYYHKKHGKIIENPIQPLLLVTGISSSLNYIKPKSDTKIKRFKLNESDHFYEHFVPELCVKVSFSSDLWIKARSLPCVLHRIEGLYRAEQLYTMISHELNLNSFLLRDKWASLKCDTKILNTMKCKWKKKSTDFDEPCVAGRISPVAEMLDMKTIEFQYNHSNKIYPWKEEQEPIDIERNIDTVSILDVEYYENFISQKLCSEIDDETSTQFIKPKLAITFENIEKVVPIQIIQKKCNTPGPELRDFYQALVAASANDIINFERYETLGDSFLKFSVALYLYLKFPEFDEGKLTYIKGQVVGNKHLFYCAQVKELGSFMNVNEFLPDFDWIPPCFCLPHDLMQYSDILPRSVLYQLNISKEERLNGSLKKSTVEQIMNIISKKECEKSLELVLNSLISQIISDKSVADCVEALIGCFLNSNGTEAALKMIGWFGILPRSDFLEKLLNQPVPSPVLKKEKTASNISACIDFHLILPESLEKIIGYKFKNRAYILQAFSHSSYNANKLTDCYQRLEFLGDAILDFLITCHIYETCGNLSPGELTDLRSSLVNNIVFGSLVVKYGLHKFLLSINPQLSNAILKFVKHQEENNFTINDNILILLEENDYNLATYVDVPKMLGDLFESLAGAIFLDSGMNLEIVWQVFYKLMRSLIEEFSRNVPKNVLRKLYEETKAAPKFCDMTTLEDGKVMVGVTFWVDGHKKKVYGYGENKKFAKMAAAKIALKALAANEQINAQL